MKAQDIPAQTPEGWEAARKALLAGIELRWVDAERHYRTWMKLEPDNPHPKYWLSQLLLVRGDFEQGFELYEARTEIPGWTSILGARL